MPAKLVFTFPNLKPLVRLKEKEKPRIKELKAIRNFRNRLLLFLKRFHPLFFKSSNAKTEIQSVDAR